MRNPYLKKAFEEGAKSVAVEFGMSEKRAECFSNELCKLARDDDDDDTWIGRNKWWMIPTGVGLGAFLLGAGSERFGRPDRSYLSNAGSFIWDRLKKLFGVNESPIWNSFTKADPRKRLTSLNAVPKPPPRIVPNVVLKDQMKNSYGNASQRVVPRAVLTDQLGMDHHVDPSEKDIDEKEVR